MRARDLRGMTADQWLAWYSQPATESAGLQPFWRAARGRCAVRESVREAGGKPAVAGA
jgi:hypothetical protein